MEEEKQRLQSNLKLFLPMMMKKIPELREATMSKDAKSSEKFRDEANQLYMKKSHSNYDHLQIWRYYSKSVALAPPASKELSSALYNRSSLLFHLHKYSDCVQDLILAEKINCSDVMKMKMIHRKAECYIKTKSSSDTDIVDTAIAEIGNLSLDEKIKNETIAKLKKMGAGSTTISKNIKEEDAAGETFNVNFQVEIPCASNALALKFNEDFGRHVVATRDIKPGEILAVERMFPLLDQSALYTHCSNCSKVTWSSVSCESCALAVYCSETCKNDAWSKYHDIECNIIGLLDLETSSGEVESQSVRLMVRALKESKGSISSLRKKMKRIDSTSDYRNRGYSADGIFRSETCDSYLSLLTNANKKTLPALQDTSKRAAKLVYFLAVFTKIFGKKYKADDLSSIAEQEDILFVGSLISRMYHMNLTNRFLVSEQVHVYSRKEATMINDEQKIGTAVAPFCSFINHACLPNVDTCTTEDGRLIVFSVLPINKDAQIFRQYKKSISCDVCPRDMRKEAMRELYYIYDCRCIACTGDFPTAREAPEIYRVANDRQVLILVDEIYTQNNAKLSIGVKKMIKMIMKCLELMVKKSLHKCKDFYRLMGMMINFFHLMHDRWFQIPLGCKKAK
ncbi:hypothetical protein QAD02_008710 [Eretmocerus hayati]|uniref:Uncharacterized protein n=1 Tax=Eretmocerus hayati TaxID=131215 RepID=A0ACC2N7U9_9HYME|nr:hypothetical protein QAD02_008710 [Eretmocerus hayati]